MSSLTSTEITEKYTEILKSHGILDPIAKVTTNARNLRDEGMGSDRQCITVTFENANLKPLNLFAKLVITGNQSHFEMMDDLKGFEKESMFLTKYVNDAKELCKRKGLEENLVTDIYPKCYFGDNKMIVLENLVEDKGYTLLGKTERHDIGIARIALTTLAKHHAISYAMIQEAGGPENFFQRFPVLQYEGFDKPGWISKMDPWLDSAVKTNIKILEACSDLKGSSEALTKLKQIYQRSPSLCGWLAKCLIHDDNGFICLGHGDYWYANMVFLKDPITNKIIGHKAVDLQIVRYNAPGLDLAYYLFTSLKTDVRQNHLEELLQTYLATLNQVANDFGHPINLSYDSILRQFRKKLDFGFLPSLIVQYGPGMGLFKNTDMTNVTNWGVVVDKLASEWIAENPEGTKNIAEELIRVLKEYSELEMT